MTTGADRQIRAGFILAQKKFVRPALRLTVPQDSWFTFAFEGGPRGARVSRKRV